MAGKYHYEYFAYTDNMCYGRMKLAQDRSRTMASVAAQWAGKGCYRIEKHRVYDKNDKQ